MWGNGFSHALLLEAPDLCNHSGGKKMAELNKFSISHLLGAKRRRVSIDPRVTKTKKLITAFRSVVERWEAK